VLAEANDDDVYMGLAASFAGPCKSLVGEVDGEMKVGEEVIPEDAGLLALSDGVCGDESCFDVRPIHIAGSFDVPSRHVIEYARA